MNFAIDPSLIQINAFVAMTLGIVVYFIGVRLTGAIPFLRAYSIPEPVSGGILAALIGLAIVLLTGREVAYDLTARDALLVYFFTTVGLNARIEDLIRGGPILGLMLVLTIGFMFVQGLIGVLGVTLFGMPPQAGVMTGTAALIGGHGTAIAWGPVIEGEYGVAGAAELGIASATVGLIMASLLGGPIAKFLIERRGAAPDDGDGGSQGGAALQEEGQGGHEVSNVNLLRAVLWIHVAIAFGIAAHEALEAAGAKLPVFVPCLLAGILLSNTTPRVFRRLEWPAGTPAMNLVQEFSLSVFLAMSLMSMELWTLAGSAGPLIVTMTLQAAATTAFILFVVFPLMGRNYFAAVISSGFAGFTLGATPTAIANMTAVTQRYGPSPLAFIVLPLISAFFVDIANAFIIQLFLSF